MKMMAAGLLMALGGMGMYPASRRYVIALAERQPIANIAKWWIHGVAGGCSAALGAFIAWGPVGMMWSLIPITGTFAVAAISAAMGYSGEGEEGESSATRRRGLPGGYGEG